MGLTRAPLHYWQLGHFPSLRPAHDVLKNLLKWLQRIYSLLNPEALLNIHISLRPILWGYPFMMVPYWVILWWEKFYWHVVIFPEKRGDAPRHNGSCRQNSRYIMHRHCQNCERTLTHQKDKSTEQILFMFDTIVSPIPDFAWGLNIFSAYQVHNWWGSALNQWSIVTGKLMLIISWPGVTTTHMFCYLIHTHMFTNVPRSLLVATSPTLLCSCWFSYAVFWLYPSGWQFFTQYDGESNKLPTIPV